MLPHNQRTTMEQSRLLNHVSSLNDIELHQLCHHVLETLAHRGYQAVPSFLPGTHDQLPSDSHRTASSSSAPTLQQSESSSPRAKSTHNGGTTPLETGGFYEPQDSYLAGGLFEPRHPNDSASWPVTPTIADNNMFNASVSQETLHGDNKEVLPVACHPARLTSSGNIPTKRPYFCTFCAEVGITLTCKTKHDWKRHEQQFHETGNEWHCEMSGCVEVFAREQDFKKHYDKNHLGLGYPRSSQVLVQQQRVYACGFDGCRNRTSNWKDRCDHVARCMQKGTVEWNYTWKIRNLLRHPDISGTWKMVRSRWCHDLGIDPSELKWDPKTTRNLRQQLECHTFGTDLEALLDRLFWVGHPHHRVSDKFPVHPNSSVPPDPPTDLPLLSSGFEGVLFPVRQSFRYAPMLSQVDQHQNPAFRDPGYAENAHLATASCHRNSVFMPDAPPLPDIEDQSPQQDLMTWQEFVYSPTYSTNTTSPLSETPSEDAARLVHDTAKLCTPRNLMSKSKEWLASKRSQHFQPPIIDHPGVAPSSRMPASSPSKATLSGPSGFGVNGMYNNQS